MRRRHQRSLGSTLGAHCGVVGVIAVIVIAVFFFMGSGGSAGQPAASGDPHLPRAEQQCHLRGFSKYRPSTRQRSRNSLPSRVPATGVYVKVNYIGSFSGKYGINGVLMSDDQDSGEKVYEVVNATGARICDIQEN